MESEFVFKRESSTLIGTKISVPADKSIDSRSEDAEKMLQKSGRWIIGLYSSSSRTRIPVHDD